MSSGPSMYCEPPPLLRHLLTHALGALLALADQPPYQEERDAEHEDQSADEEEFKGGAA